MICLDDAIHRVGPHFTEEVSNMPPKSESYSPIRSNSHQNDIEHDIENHIDLTADFDMAI